MKIAIIGLGYVGLPLAVEFSKKFEVVGFDINANRVAQLNSGIDETLEISSNELKKAHSLVFTATQEELVSANIYIVTVPTPVDANKQPDLTPLIRASELLGRVLKVSDIVVYESTVYPGATEEVCVPVLEKVSGLAFNKDFFVGYSPERINPGDKTHRLSNIVKITSGSTKEVAEVVDKLYREIVTVGTHKASSIKVAEAAKVIENTQRDVNIALINELAIIFNKLGIDTQDVLEAAGTKWNFLPFRPGLVGGHCIGVDPYYLTHKAQSSGYIPDMIIAGRRINDGMGAYVSGQLIRAMANQRIQIHDSKVLILGLSFKENCPDIRNTRVVDIVRELTTYHMQVHIHDPWCSPEESQRELNIQLVSNPKNDTYDAILLAVAHEQFVELGIKQLRALGKKEHIFYDIKSIFPSDEVDLRL